MITTDVIEIDFPVARPKLRGGGSEVETILSCKRCNRIDKVTISIRCHGEKRMFGCFICGSQMEVEVRPQTLRYI